MKKFIGVLALSFIMSASLLGNEKVKAAGSNYDYLTGVLRSSTVNGQKVICSDGRTFYISNTGWLAYTKVLVTVNNKGTVDTRDDILVSISKLNY